MVSTASKDSVKPELDERGTERLRDKSWFNRTFNLLQGSKPKNYNVGETITRKQSNRLQK